VRLLSKLCDAADWCDPVFDRIIRDELAEEPYFHRKQWEFAQIFRALQAHGFLNGRSRGLSMGGGDERLLYAVARRVGHLTVTDLYQAGSSWDGARTEDPDRSLKAAAPFAVDPSRFTARRMDMRALEFGASSLDFCYSSCAIEHIGEYADFLEHLREVRRVLKDDGVYVLTTEFHYGDQVIPAPHNYYFSAGFLDGLMKTAGFAARDGVDGTVSRHPFNRPLPANLGELTARPAEAVTDMLLKSAPHVQLLTGGLPFTSMSLVLTKAAPGGGGILPIFNLEPSREAIAEGVGRWKAFVEHAGLSLDPRVSDDCRAASGVSRLVRAGGGALFHTGYVWLGNGQRTVTVDLDLWPADGVDAAVEVRVHRHPDLRPDDVTCAGSTSLAIRARARVRARLQIASDVGFSYAVLGRVTSGGCWIGDAEVHVGATDSTDLF
jgi:SAM-dependent methyltransferase